MIKIIIIEPIIKNMKCMGQVNNNKHIIWAKFHKARDLELSIGNFGVNYPEDMSCAYPKHSKEYYTIFLYMEIN